LDDPDIRFKEILMIENIFEQSNVYEDIDDEKSVIGKLKDNQIKIYKKTFFNHNNILITSNTKNNNNKKILIEKYFYIEKECLDIVFNILLVIQKFFL